MFFLKKEAEVSRQHLKKLFEDWLKDKDSVADYVCLVLTPLPKFWAIFWCWLTHFTIVLNCCHQSSNNFLGSLMDTKPCFFSKNIAPLVILNHSYSAEKSVQKQNWVWLLLRPFWALKLHGSTWQLHNPSTSILLRANQQNRNNGNFRDLGLRKWRIISVIIQKLGKTCRGLRGWATSDLCPDWVDWNWGQILTGCSV